jgi:4-methylaminobutanoate oxidase (formaldehyde-forming)
VHVSVAIVGGGILGCASAWHLARAGVRDVVVLERGELNAATTSQAAGLIGQLRTSAVKTAIVQQTLADIAALSADGHATGFRKTGSLRLALTAEREAEILEQVSAGRRFGVDVVLVSAKDVARLAPGVEVPDRRVAAWLPGDGYAEPYTLATAYANAARALGVKFLTGRAVTAVEVKAGRARGVATTQGPLAADTVVIAAGAWTAPVAATASARVPVFPVRHQAWVTAPMPWVSASFPVIRIPDRWAYLRPEVGGLMFGFFEPTPTGIDPEALPSGFTIDRVPRDAAVMTSYASELVKVVPGLDDAPIVGSTAGLPTFTPDGQFVVGAVDGVAGLLVASGCCAHGIAGSGGVGRAVAEAVTGGSGAIEAAPLSPGRFGAKASDRAWVRVASEATYAGYYGVVRRA